MKSVVYAGAPFAFGSILTGSGFPFGPNFVA